MSITICLSHKEDVDGISSAVLINSAFKKVSTIPRRLCQPNK